MQNAERPASGDENEKASTDSVREEIRSALLEMIRRNEAVRRAKPK
jgi:hypothetical protein